MNGYPDYSNISWPQPQNNIWGSPLKTNKILVTSLDEAIAKSNERNSEMYYWDQSKPVIYVIKTDVNGVKSWAQVNYTLPSQDANVPASKADVVALTAPVNDLVKKIENIDFNKGTKKKKAEMESEVNDNVESNG